jgi:hypothetical protein
MNAPLPVSVARDGTAYDAVAGRFNEVAGRLAERLATQTRGDVLFSLADRGRYATDASIYQALPVGVFVPRTTEDVRIALDICRDLQVPIVPRGGGTSQCGQTVGAGLVIDHSRHLRQVLQVDAQARTVEVEPGIVLDHLNQSLKSSGCGSRSTCPPARRPRSAAWRATTPAAAAASPTATWSTT